jgi:hypothetical protein
MRAIVKAGRILVRLVGVENVLVSERRMMLAMISLSRALVER